MSATSPMEAAPDLCPGCAVEWTPHNTCPRCGISQADVRALFNSAAEIYSRARGAALKGDFEETLEEVQRARGVGLTFPAIDQLEAICLAVTGNWQALRAEHLPPGWMDAIRSGSVEREYANALEALNSEDWERAIIAAQSAKEAAPWLVPARQALFLGLYGSDRTEEANPLLYDFGDKYPWAKSRRPLSVGSPEVTPGANGSSNPQERVRITFIGFARVAAVGLGGLCLGLGAGLLFRAPPTFVHQSAGLETARVKNEPVELPARRATDLPSNEPGRAGAGTSDSRRVNVASTMPQLSNAGLKHLNSEKLRGEFRVARRLFNTALVAFRRGDYGGTSRLSQDVFAISPSSYLAEEALLLDARAADASHRPDAEAKYIAIADRAPGSVYAPVGLFHAARLLIARGRREEAKGIVARMRKTYPNCRLIRRVPPL